MTSSTGMVPRVDILLLLRDGLSVGFDLDDPAAVRPAVREALARVLGPVGAASR